jgi:predicted HicB family RNase H-like nuclease
MPTQPKKDPMPHNVSREELARFWETHSVADYWDELKPVKVKVAKHLSDTLNVRFEPEDVTKIRQVAQQKGIGPTTLIRMWVREHLQV